MGGGNTAGAVETEWLWVVICGTSEAGDRKYWLVSGDEFGFST